MKFNFILVCFYNSVVLSKLTKGVDFPPRCSA